MVSEMKESVESRSQKIEAGAASDPRVPASPWESAGRSAATYSRTE